MKSLNEIEREIKILAADGKADKILVVSDSKVLSLAPEFLDGCPKFPVLSGEENKNLRQVERIWEFFENNCATRRSIVVNFGGGMISDMGGFAAATFKRGIRCINVATTLLAAVDASIGGKTGVNFKGLKNEIGAFSLPAAVFPATSLFPALPQAEWLSGYGEMLKTALLMNKAFYGEVSKENFIVDRNLLKIAEAVDKCAAFKTEVVEKDFREGGLRKILNLGHTAGHAFEMVCLEKGSPVAHGIAVAYGILTSLVLSRLILKTGPDLMYGYINVLKNNFPRIPVGCPDMDRIVYLMGHDKKNFSSGTPRFVLLENIGCPAVDVEPSPTDLAAALEITFEHIN